MKYSILQAAVYIIILSIVTVQNSRSFAQTQMLYFDEAVKAAIVNYPEIRTQKLEIEKAEGELDRATIFPNPSFSFYNEKLASGSINGGESIYAIDQSLNFLWTRSSEFFISSF